MDVSVLTLQTFSGIVMVLWCSLTLTCLINTVCELLLASHFSAGSGCFMVGPCLSCSLSYTVYVPTSITYGLLLLCIVTVLRCVITIVDNLCLIYCKKILTLFVCDSSVGSRSGGPVSCFPTHRQLSALVLHPAFL